MCPHDALNSRDSDQLSATDRTPSGSQDLLQRVMQVFRKWLECIPVHDHRIKNLNATEVLIQNILESGAYSENYVMTTAHTLLCTNCRRLEAAPEKCSERSLDRCPLLKGIGA